MRSTGSCGPQRSKASLEVAVRLNAPPHDAFSSVIVSVVGSAEGDLSPAREELFGCVKSLMASTNVTFISGGADKYTEEGCGLAIAAAHSV